MIQDELGEVVKCSVPGCEKDASAKGLCIKHYLDSKRPGHEPYEKPIKAQDQQPEKEPEPKKGCLECGRDLKIIGRGLCGNCYGKLKKSGQLDKYEAKTKHAPRAKKSRHETKPPEKPSLPTYMQGIIQNTINTISIDLARVPGLQDWLNDKASKELRTIEAQALYVLKGAMGFDLGSRPKCNVD